MWEYNHNTPTELYHHGIKGQKWGVRRYQYADGSLTPAGQKRYNAVKGPPIVNQKVSHVINKARTVATGRQYVDTCLKKGTTFSRIQTSENFENFAFYATYKKADSNKYMGLFGKNLTSRANAEAKSAEKKANKTGDDKDIENAKALRDKADNMKVYQLKIEATNKLKVPSDENAAHITSNLLKDSEFKKNLSDSIDFSKTQMRRPTQQLLLKQAQDALKKDGNLSSSDKVAVYKALNLSLTFHNKEQIAVQNKFYGEMKKKGYNALLDYNDKDFSSYHAKRPMIVFDLDSVTLKSVAPTNQKVVDKMYTRYNAERLLKEIPANTVSYIGRYSGKKVSDCRDYVNRKRDNYLQ